MPKLSFEIDTDSEELFEDLYSAMQMICRADKGLNVPLVQACIAMIATQAQHEDTRDDRRGDYFLEGIQEEIERMYNNIKDGGQNPIHHPLGSA